MTSLNKIEEAVKGAETLSGVSKGKRRPRKPGNSRIAAIEAIGQPQAQRLKIFNLANSADPNLRGVLQIMEGSELFCGLVAFDEMRRQIMLMHPVPSAEWWELGSSDEWILAKHVREFEPRPLADIDTYAVLRFLQGDMNKLTLDPVQRAIECLAIQNRFHPVRDYLGNLKWDGVERLEGWLTTYLGAERSPYLEEIGPMVLVASVARIFKPGCKADYMMVLEGPQGARKSSACKVLGGEWFDDNLPDLTSEREAAQHIRGKWFLEIPELSAMGRADSQRLKAFVSRQVERYRPPYGRNEVVEQRQCVFIGTTNQDVYLRDETGGRRFWPVRVGVIDTEQLAKDRDQLFAEAVAKYRDGFRWWPDGEFEREHIMPQQEARRESDSWEDDIRGYLGGRKITLVSEVARHGLGIEAARLGTSEQRRIAAVMLTLGWRREKQDRDGNRWWSCPNISAEDYRATVLERRRVTAHDSRQRTSAHNSYRGSEAGGDV